MIDEEKLFQEAMDKFVKKYLTLCHWTGTGIALKNKQIGYEGACTCRHPKPFEVLRRSLNKLAFGTYIKPEAARK